MTTTLDEDPSQPAFPRSYTAEGHNGMTLRDYFAGQAVNRLLGLALQLEATGRLEKDAPETCAVLSYKIADAMLEARKR